MPIEIAGQECPVRRPALRCYEAAFLLQEPVAVTRNRLRRGERLQARRVSDEEIVARGALPVSSVARGRGVRPTILAKHERVAGNPMAIELLRSLVAGQFRAPNAASIDKQPPPLDSRLHRL